MDYLHLIESMSPAVYRRLVRAVELGKWPDGKALSREQREISLQAIIAWGQLHLPETERVGYLRDREPVEDGCSSASESPLKWLQQE